MKKGDISKKEKGSAYTSVVTEYKHECKDCLCNELHVKSKNPTE